MTTELPLWAVYVISFGTPTAALLGVLVGHLVNRLGSTELEKRSRREEVMRALRWAAELAVDPDPRKSALGVSQLEALAESDLLDDVGQAFVDAALATVLLAPVDQLDELDAEGEDADVLELDPTVDASEDVASDES